MRANEAVWLTEDAGGVTIEVLVTPRASRTRIGPVSGDRLKVAVTSPPVDGAANEAVVELFARALGIAKRQVQVVRGAGSRRKTIRIEEVSADAITSLVA